MAEYRRTELFAPPQVNTGQAEVFGTLADRLRGFSQILANQGDVRADRALRSYVLSQYADVTQNMARIQAESGTDVEKFNASVKGYMDGTLRGTDARARQSIAEIIQKQAAERGSQIAELAVSEQRANQKAETIRGLDAMRADISTKLASGDPAKIADAEALSATFQAHIRDGIADGTFTEREGLKYIDDSLKQGVREVTFGQLDRALNTGGDAVAVAEAALQTPGFSDPERVELATQVLQRLNLHQRMDAERHALEVSEVKGAYEQGEKEATMALLQGKLTIAKIEQLVSEDRLDPTVARTLRNELKSGGPSVDDDQTAFRVSTDLLSYTEQQIGSMPGLSWDTRAKLIEKRRSQVGRWPDTNSAQEARARIDRALGIVPGTQQMVSDEKGRQRGAALTDWFNRIEALPEVDRERSAIRVAEEVITERIRLNKADEAARLRRSLESWRLKQGDPAEMGKSARAAYDAELAKRQTRIEAAEREAGK